MIISLDLKNELLRILQQQVDERISTAKSGIQSVQLAKGNETKSSAGDKFETGRAMMQAEQDRFEVMLSKNQNLADTLKSIRHNKSSDKIGLGALVLTSEAVYFLSIGIGKIMFDENEYYAVSPQSPIGQLLIDKKKGDTVQFRDRGIKILDIK